MYNRVKAMVTLSIMVLCLTGCDARTSIVDIVTGEENDKQSAYESSSSVTDDTTSRNYEEQSEENSNETKTDSTEKDSMQSDSYSRDDSDTYDANQEEEKTDEQNHQLNRAVCRLPCSRYALCSDNRSLQGRPAALQQDKNQWR